MMDDRTISINVEAVIDNLLAGMKQGERSVQNFATTAVASLEEVEQSSERISRLWKSMFEAFIGFEAVKGLLDVAKAANEANDALEIMARTAKNFGNSLDPAKTEKWLDQFARSAQGGGYALDQLRLGYQRFIDTGADGAQAQRLLADATNLAAARNIDLAQAVQIVNYAQTGHVEMLTRYGIVSREAAKNITTVEQAIEALEKATSGAAAERAKGLEGALGRLASTSEKLRDAIGGGLLPILTGIINALDHLEQLILKIPTPILDTAVAIAGLVVGATALAIALPAVVKIVAMLREGFALMMVPIKPLIGQLGMLEEAFRNAALGDTALLDSMMASLGPIALIVAAIVGLAVVLVEVVNHMDHVKTAWHDGLQYMSDSFGEFVDGVKKDAHNLIPVLGALAYALTHPGDPTAAANLAVAWATSTPNATISSGRKLVDDAGTIGNDIKRDWSNIMKSIFGIFTGGSADMSIPHPNVDGDVPSHGQRKSHAKKGFGDWLGNALGKLGNDAWILPGAQFADTPWEMDTTSIPLLQQQQEKVRHNRGMAQANGTLTPALSAQYDAQNAEIEKQIALIKEENAQRTYENAQLKESEHDTAANREAVQKALGDVLQAHDAVSVAGDRAAEALTAFGKATADATDAANKQHTKWLSQLAGRVPGMSEKYTQTGQFSGFNFDWMSVLVQVIERSKSFADIMTVVNDIMNVFAQVINALQPVIDALLQVLLGIVQVFIGLWNVMVKVLELFGIHVQQLSLANAEQNNLTQATVPLVQIFHDMPTLAEYATGNTSGPYSPIGGAIQQQFTNPIENALKSTDLGGGIFGVLGEMLGVLLLIKEIEAAKAAFEAASGGSGIFGTIVNGIKSFLGFGSSIPEGAGPEVSIDAFGNVEQSVSDLANLLPQNTADAIDESQTGDAIQTVMDNTQVSADASQGVGSGSYSATATASSAMQTVVKGLTGVADVAGLIGGFKQGGIMGGISAGMSMDSLALLMGATGGLATPLAIGAGLIAAIFGGGGHQVNAHDNPDIVEQGQYGQAMADLGGSGNNGVPLYTANGQQFSESSQLSKQLGGQGEIAYLSNWIKQNPSQAKSLLSSTALADFSGANGNEYYQKNGMVQLGGNGVTAYWSDLANAASDSLQKILQAIQSPTDAMNDSLTKIAKSITGTLDPFNQLTDALTLAGTAVPMKTTPAPTPAPPSGGSGSGSGSGSGTGDPSTPVRNPKPPTGSPGHQRMDEPVVVNLNVTHTGDINTHADIASFSQDLAVQVQRSMPNRAYRLQ